MKKSVITTIAIAEVFKSNNSFDEERVKNIVCKVEKKLGIEILPGIKEVRNARKPGEYIGSEISESRKKDIEWLCEELFNTVANREAKFDLTNFEVTITKIEDESYSEVAKVFGCKCARTM